MRFEDKLKKDLDNAIGADKEPSKELYAKVLSNQSLNKKKKYNFKPLIFALSFCIILFVAGLSLIKQNTTPKNTYNAIIKIDVNPSIEMIVNEKNEVIAANGLNDEGKMILCNETIVGKTLNDSLKQVIELEISLGYLSKGNNNEITFTIGAKNNEIANNLTNNIKDITHDTLNKRNISANIKNTFGYSKDELINKIKMIDSTLKIEEITNFDYDELVNKIKTFDLEMAQFSSIKLEEYFLQYRNYEKIIEEKKLIQSAIKNVNNLYQEIYENYVIFISELKETYQTIQQSYYDFFINPESDYQKSLMELAKVKEEYLIQQNIVENMSDSDLSKLLETIKLSKIKTEYETTETILSSIEIACQKSFDLIINSFESIIEKLTSLEERLPTSISSITFRQQYNTEEKINHFNDEIMRKFINQYQEDINNFKTEMLNKKINLINSLKNN